MSQTGFTLKDQGQCRLIIREQSYRITNSIWNLSTRIVRCSQYLPLSWDREQLIKLAIKNRTSNCEEVHDWAYVNLNNGD